MVEERRFKEAMLDHHGLLWRVYGDVVITHIEVGHKEGGMSR